MKLLLTSVVLSATIFCTNANDFTNIVNAAVDVNPDIQNLALEAHAGNLALKTENNLENPEISFEGLFGQFGDNKYNLALSQAFDWPGLYSSRSKYAAAANQLALANLSVEKSSKRAEINETLLGIINSNQKISNLNLLCDNFNQLLATYEQLYTKGEVTILDLNKLRVEVAELEIARDDELLNIEALKATFAQLCGYNADLIAQAESLSEYPLVQLLPLEQYQTAAADAPEIVAAQLKSRLNQLGVDVAAKETLPGFSLGYRFSHEDGQIFNGLTFGMSIPAWGNKGKRAAAVAALSASDFAVTNIENNIAAQINSDYRKAAMLRQRIAAYATAVENTDNIRLLERAFSAGQMDLPTFLSEVNYFIDALNNLSDLNLRYHLLLASLSNYR